MPNRRYKIKINLKNTIIEKTLISGTIKIKYNFIKLNYRNLHLYCHHKYHIMYRQIVFRV